mmetsp:Transcript_7308/g.15887  ORF Transcript_7308/g.15887 Transcript_7308/m.15887 type:complete len:172 (+) Transcript_7308:804-1319(+)
MMLQTLQGGSSSLKRTPRASTDSPSPRWGAEAGHPPGCRPTSPNFWKGRAQRGSFEDANDDGECNSDPAIKPTTANVNVPLFPCGDVTSIPSRLLAVDRTDRRGFYSFRNLYIGHYRVMVQPPPGYRLSLKWTRSNGEEVDSAMDPAVGITQCFALGGSGVVVSRTASGCG